MRKLGGCFMLVLFVAGAFFFVRQWRSVTPWGVGTGAIGGRSDDLRARDKRAPTVKARSTLIQVVENPGRFTNKTVRVTGRVRGARRLASNRNIYRLIDGEHRLLVIDDKAPPKNYELRTVSGRVGVVKPPLGQAGYAYIISVKQGVKFKELTWNETKGWFTGKYDDIKQVVKESVREW